MTKNVFIYVLPIINILPFSYCIPVEDSVNQPNFINIFLDDAGFADNQSSTETRFSAILSKIIKKRVGLLKMFNH